MVSVLAFYYDNPNSDPAEQYNFSLKLLLYEQKRPGLARISKLFSCQVLVLFKNHITQEFGGGGTVVNGDVEQHLLNSLL